MRKINTQDFTRATRSTSREINRQIVLNLVREHQPISRADLARHMNVARGMLTAVVKELLADGSIVEGPIAGAPRGRRPVMLCLRTHDRLVIGVDIRSSCTYVMLADFAGTELALEKFETVFSPARLVDEIGSRILRLTKAHSGVGEVEGVGVAVPGVVGSHGQVLNAPQLGWKRVSIRDEIATATGLPVQVENASAACALAYMWAAQRAGDRYRDFVYINVSDGVGAGIVVNGQLVQGHDHTAGEVGHISIDPDGPECLCGARGCWEAYTSNLATLGRYLGEPSFNGHGPVRRRREITMAELISRARDGDERARTALSETGRYLGVGLSIIVNTLNPGRIVVGGEITAAWDLVHHHLTTGVAERALTASAARTPIIPEHMGDYPRLRGATVLVTAPIFAAPELA